MRRFQKLNKKELDAIFSNTFKCLDFIKTIPWDNEIIFPIEKGKTKFHMLWLGDESTFGRKQSLPVKSFLATQNLENSELILWTSSSLRNNSHLREIYHLITNNVFDFQEQSVGTPLEGFEPLKEFCSQCNTIAADLARIILLYKYSGVYIDSDVILLRNFEPLLSNDFLYKWENRNWTNNAVMHFSLNSRFCNLLINEVLNYTSFSFWTLCRDVYTKVLEKCDDVVIYPCPFFDPDWLIEREKIFEIFFKNDPSSSQLYEGVFAYHWHGNWSLSIESGSKFHNYEIKIHQLLKEKLDIEVFPTL